MADVEAMDSSAVSEEEVADRQDDESSRSRSSSKISAVGEIIEGKRAKKTVERLDIQAPKQREKLKIGDGSGDKLGEIPRTCHQINRMKLADLKPLHAILFDRPGKMTSIKKNLRLFNGFAFDADSEQYGRKRDKLLKTSSLTNSKLKVVCTVLDLEKKGTHSDLIDRILNFLIAPKNSGKPVPMKKKKKSKKNLSGDDSKTSGKKKSKPKTKMSASPKKSKTGSKSEEILMDSSSDEDEDDEEEEKVGASAEAEASDTEEKPSEKEEEEEEEEEEESEQSEEEEDDDEVEEEESSRSKSAREQKKKSSAPLKRPRAPTKKTGPPNKRKKQKVSDESESDEKPKKKKPAAKTKMADSSSSRKHMNTASDSSDDDEPLIRMIKKPPSEDQLTETLQALLKEADLEEMTMKQICQKVFDTYPKHDLSSKKDFIKRTVKALIT